MDLNVLWFILVVVLFTGFFILEGFDYGVGILLPFIAKNDQDRRMVINTIGPFWDGNEVWILTAGGAIFAAFPNWYATMFSGFYLALVLMLFALIARGVAFEFRSKDANPTWRSLWDGAIFVGSLVPSLVWGIALTNLVRGLPIDATMTYMGGFFTLLNPMALLGGLTTLALFILQGAIFLSLKTTDDLLARAIAITKKVAPVTTGVVLLFTLAGYFMVDSFTPLGILAVVLLAATVWLTQQNRFGAAFITNSLGIALTNLTIFLSLFPRVMVSSLNPQWSLTIYSASSSPYTLKIMTMVAFVFVPIVLMYQGWTYWVFRQRISREVHLEY